jgi:DNA repair exonuclease SbcCD ATPase subunit
VLVITHLDELKDQFGTQIRVEKASDGSVFSIEPG